MASAVWCGGGVEGALLAAPRGTEPYLLRGGGGGWYRDGLDGQPRVGTGRPAEEEQEEGGIRSFGGEPAVMKQTGFSAVKGEAQFPRVLVGEDERVESMMQREEEKEEGKIRSQGVMRPPAVYCGRPVRRVARRTLPVKAVPIKKAAAAAAAEGDAPAAVACKRAFRTVLYCGRVRKGARRTAPVDGPPLKKAPPWTHQQQHPTGFKGASAASPYSNAGEGAGPAEGGMLPARHCTRRSVDAYELLNKVGEGTYGEVFRARDRETGEMLALKKVDMDETAIREISILASLRLRHPCNIVALKEVVFDVSGRPEDGVYVVMEYAEYDLRRVIEGMKRPFDQSEAKFLMQQLLQAVHCIHGCGVLHRDLKASNVLLTRCGELKVCDFGLSRRCSGGIGDQRPYTNWVGTLLYRAPELLLKDKKGYSAAMDMWSVGCIMAELLSKEPLFQGTSELDQLDQIFGVLGTPDEGTWPDFAVLCDQMRVGFPCRQPCGTRLKEKLPPSCLSEAGYDLLMGLLTYDPSRRLTAEQALHHEWFGEFPPPTELRFSLDI